MEDRRGGRAAAGALLLVLAMLCFAPSASAFKVQVAPGKTECISEHVGAEHFDVPGGPRVEGAAFVSAKSPHVAPSVSLRLLSPQGDQMWSQTAVSNEVHFNVAARGPGTYKACFYNGYESRDFVTIDLVYLTLGHLRRPGAALNVPKGTQEARSKQVAHADHLEEVKRSVMVVAELVDILGGEQRYLRRKVDRHIKTVISNNSRTFWYTCLEVAALLAVTGAQLATIMGFFKGQGGYGGGAMPVYYGGGPGARGGGGFGARAPRGLV